MMAAMTGATATVSAEMVGVGPGAATGAAAAAVAEIVGVAPGATMNATARMADAVQGAATRTSTPAPAGSALPPALTALRAQEDSLHVPAPFGAREALRLGCVLAELAEDEERGIAARIYREEDGLVLFQYAMDDKSARNWLFVEGKRQMAHTLGHASLWAPAWEDAFGKAPDVPRWSDGTGMGADSDAGADCPEAAAQPCPSGGAFPIRTTDGTWVATLSVSGLHEGRDHELVVRALCRFLGLAYGSDVPVYPDVPR